MHATELTDSTGPADVGFRWILSYRLSLSASA